MEEFIILFPYVNLNQKLSKKAIALSSSCSIANSTACLARSKSCWLCWRNVQKLVCIWMAIWFL